MPELPNITLATTDAVSLLSSLTMAVALAAVAGLRAWLPLLAAGVLGRLGVIQLGDSFMFLTSLPAILAFTAATAFEMAGDKIPMFDHALDAVGNVMRPAAAVLLAASVMFEIKDPLWALGIGLIVGAPTAAVPHTAKALLRTASTLTTGGLGNPLLSAIEDVISVVMLVLAVFVPLVLAILVALVTLWIFRRVQRRTAAASTSPSAASS